MTRIVILLALSVALVFTHGADAAASVTVYTNKPAWVAAVNSAYATETFDSGPFGTYGSISLSSGIDIIATNHGFIPNTSLTWHDQVTAGTEFTTFNFLQPIKAFGGDWDLTSYWIGTPNPLRLSLDGAPVGTLITGNGFFGVVSTSPFIDAKLTVPSGSYQNWDVDDVVYASVPEPSGAALAALALLVCTVVRLRAKTR